MSGKCISITAVCLLVLGFLVGLSVILFQEDTSEPSVERSYRPPNREKADFQELLTTRNTVFDTSAQFHPKNVTTRRKPILNTTLTEPTRSKPREEEGTLKPVPTTPTTFLPRPFSTRPSIKFDLEPLSREEVDGGLRRSGHLKLNPNDRPLYDLQGDMTVYNRDFESVPVYDDGLVEDDGSEQEFDEEESYSESDPESFEMNELLKLANRLYTSDLNVTDFQGFLQIVNETVNGEGQVGFLNQLNQLYSRPAIKTEWPIFPRYKLQLQLFRHLELHDTDRISKLDETESSSLGVGRNGYESSLTAFAFMSFGVFLLKQIHNLLEKTTTETVEGRHFGTSSVDNTQLNILFNPPSFSDNTDGSMPPDTSRVYSDASNNPTEMNNMFRAMLNLVNAYTKDSVALECIWATYCQDLDKTSANEGLYGLAARINSIGLRLIMHQISAELTLDVLLRSLLGWDGLPCKKMFPQCEPENATLTLSTQNEKVHLSQLKLVTHKA